MTLSGGGIRAAVFHLGVLRRLADEDLLESIVQLSTVSGGSLVAAALISKANMQWPSSAEYRGRLHAELRRPLTSADLFSFGAVGWKGILRFNRHLVTQRARVLAELLVERWGVQGSLRDLPDRPVWWINSTCFETGRGWRFSKREMGDWQFGRHYDPPFLLSEATAALAAIPYAIGALRLHLPKDGWYQTDPATRRQIQSRSALGRRRL